MKQSLILLGLVLLLVSCDSTTRTNSKSIEVHVLPYPKEILTSKTVLELTKRSKLYSSDNELAPLIGLLQLEIKKITGIDIGISEIKNQDADIIFEIDTTLAAEEYHLNINSVIQVTGGSYRALAMAKTTLLQLVARQDDVLVFPVVNVKDYPDVKYRGLMIDLATHWHSTASIKQLIDLVAFYKINYLQLHFTDYYSYTLPSKNYPELSSIGRSYSYEELKELEAYSQLRGVTIIPEIDVPGHSSPFAKEYPELFAIKDVGDNPMIINMGKEEVYQALDLLIGEMTDIFRATPYFHIGGDEVIFTKVMDDPDVQTYMVEHELGKDVNELYRHFLIRMNDIVKKHNKQMCVWEGFRREGEIPIPKDIMVFEFETNRYLPNHLVDDGYHVVNTSWKPLYVVNEKKWEPKTIYNWNLWLWENWWNEAPSYTPIQIDESPLVVGAQMCTWGQEEDVEIPSLRKRLPAFQERIWNTEEKISYEQFMAWLEQTDKRLSALINNNRQDSLLIDYNFIEPDIIE